jgi:hypothetical protein
VRLILNGFKCYAPIIIYLPPPLKATEIDEAVDYILQVYGKSTLKEPLPEWTESIELCGLADVKK